MGKNLRSEAFGEQGPGLDVDLAYMESVALVGAKALMSGVCEALTEPAVPCPPAVPEPKEDEQMKDGRRMTEDERQST